MLNFSLTLGNNLDNILPFHSDTISASDKDLPYWTEYIELADNDFVKTAKTTALLWVRFVLSLTLIELSSTHLG